MITLVTITVREVVAPAQLQAMDQATLSAYLLGRVYGHYVIDEEIWPVGDTVLCDASQGGTEKSRLTAAQLTAFYRYCDNGSVPNEEFRQRALVAIQACLESLDGELFTQFLGARNLCRVLYQLY